MSATLDSLAAHKWTTVRAGAAVTHTIHQRPTSGSATGLREIAAEQAAALRGAFGAQNLPATPQAQRAAVVRERVAAHRARVAEHSRTVTTPAASVRPTASVRSILDVQPNQDGSTPQVPYALLDAAAAEIGQGYFALRRGAASTSGNTVTFFAVMPMRGKGTLRIRQLLGAPGGWSYRNLSAKEQFHALRHLLGDAQAARNLFADLTVSCWRCKSPLTNDESRARRLGPECVKHV